MISPTYRQRRNDLADAINAKIASAAETAGVQSITDEVVAAFAGREACAPQEMIGSLTMHPNAAGHQAYAQLVASGVRAFMTRTRTIDERTVPPSDPARTPADDTGADPDSVDEPPTDGASDQPQGDESQDEADGQQSGDQQF
jgi:hypothetical protein